MEKARSEGATLEEAAHAIQCEVVSTISKAGWIEIKCLQNEHGLAYSYTIGLWKTFRFPEIIVFGTERVRSILPVLVKRLEAGYRPEVNRFHLCYGATCGAPNPSLFRFVPVAECLYSDYLHMSQIYYKGEHFPCLQLTFYKLPKSMLKALQKDVKPRRKCKVALICPQQPDLSGAGDGSLDPTKSPFPTKH